MKKFLIIIFMAILLVGCGKDKEIKKIEKYYLDEQHYGNPAITEITLDELEKLEADKKNFAVFVYLPGCTSCAEFRTLLDKYIVEKNIEFYTISIIEAKNSSIDDAIEFAPSLVLYNKGKVVTYLDSTSDEHIPALTSSDGLTKWLEKYIYLSK